MPLPITDKYFEMKNAGNPCVFRRLIVTLHQKEIEIVICNYCGNSLHHHRIDCRILHRVSHSKKQKQ